MRVSTVDARRGSRLPVRASWRATLRHDARFGRDHMIAGFLTCMTLAAIIAALLTLSHTYVITRGDDDA